jgi:hypothetical protein
MAQKKAAPRHPLRKFSRFVESAPNGTSPAELPQHSGRLRHIRSNKFYIFTTGDALKV